MLGNPNYQGSCRDSEEPGRQTQRQPKIRKLPQLHESPCEPSQERFIHLWLPLPMTSYRQLLQAGDASTLEFHRLKLLAILKYEFCFKEGESEGQLLNPLLNGQLYLQRELVIPPAFPDEGTGHNFHYIKIISPTHIA